MTGMYPDKRSDDDLDWLAFRYAQAEMSTAEAQTFEARLASDLAACEAVARAVQLVSAMTKVQLPVEVIRRAPRTTTWKRGAALLALAAGLLLAITLWQFARTESRQSRLALAWSDLMTSLTSSDDSSETASAEDQSDDESALFDDESRSGGTAGAQVEISGDI